MFRIASIPKKSIMMIKGSRINPFTIQNRSTSFTPNTGSVSNHNNCNWCVINSACRKIAEDKCKKIAEDECKKIAEDEIKKQLTEFEKHFTEFKNVHKVDMQWLKIFSVFGLTTGMGLAGCLLKSIDDINTHMHSIDKKLDSIDEKFDSIDKKFDSIDEKFDSIDKKLDEKLDEKFDSIDKKLDEKFDSIDKKFDELKALIIQSNKRGWFY